MVKDGDFSVLFDPLFHFLQLLIFTVKRQTILVNLLELGEGCLVPHHEEALREALIPQMVDKCIGVFLDALF